MLVDTHCHLSHKNFKKTDEKIVRSALNEGVVKIITIGTDIEDSKIAVENAKKFEEVFASVGVYPHEDKNKSMEEIENGLENLIKNNEKIVAVGECGIDVQERPGEREISDQIKLFGMQIKLSQKYNLPLIIHNRNGEKQVLALLNKNKAFGVMHSFTQNWEYAQKVLDLGFYLSFSGIITYKSAGNLTEVVKKAPIENILVETDAPYLSPQPVRNQVNEPKYVKITAQKVANTRSLPYPQLCKHVYENSCRLFKFSDSALSGAKKKA